MRYMRYTRYSDIRDRCDTCLICDIDIYMYMYRARDMHINDTYDIRGIAIYGRCIYAMYIYVYICIYAIHAIYVV